MSEFRDIPEQADLSLVGKEERQNSTHRQLNALMPPAAKSEISYALKHKVFVHLSAGAGLLQRLPLGDSALCAQHQQEVGGIIGNSVVCWHQIPVTFCSSGWR